VGLLDRFRRKPEDDMGRAMSAGLGQAELGRPQSSQDLIDQSLGVNPLILSDEQATELINSLARVKHADGTIHVNPFYAALSVLASYIPAVRNLSPIDAEIASIDATCAARRLKMSMTRREYEGGGAVFIDAVLNSIIIPNILSSRKGFLVKMIKVSPKTMDISYREDKSKKTEDGFAP
jgi:hypothetical protein